jgi:hypothetical protein
MMFFWGQAIGFQVLWFNAVLGLNQWLPLGIALLAASVVASPLRRDDLRLWPLALLGFVGDLLLTYAGVFAFQQTPFWLATIWLGFVFTLNHSMGWLKSVKWPIQAAVGAVAGTLSYLAGARLGAVDLPYGQSFSAAILASYWAILLPFIVSISTRLTSYRETP